MTLAFFPILFWFKKPDYSVLFNRRVHARNLLAALSLCLEFASLNYLSLSMFILVNYTVPFFAKILSRIFLKEPIEILDFALMAVASIGLLFVVEPFSADNSDIGVALALLGAFFYASGMVVTRTVQSVDNFSMYYTYVLVLFAISLFGWPDQIPGGFDLSLIFAISIIHLVVFMLYIKGLKALKTSHTALLEYSGIVAAMVLDYAIFGKVLNPTEMVGGLLLTFAVFVSIYRRELFRLFKYRQIFLRN